MTSWRRLRTQAYLVLSVLLFLIVFLGAYALSEAKRHAVEADELLRTNFQASAILAEIESERAELVRAAAKFDVTGDAAYQALLERQRALVATSIEKLMGVVRGDAELSAVVEELARVRGTRPDPSFVQGVRELDRRLEQKRSEKLEHIREEARDLGKLILVALVIAIGVTSWLAIMLYRSVLRPLECLKEAASRIREGEFSYRVSRFSGFEELRSLRREFNAMASKIEELDSMKSDFLSTVSHELRTPLTALKEGLALLSEKQGQLPPNVSAKTLEICNQASKRLETLIQNLLDHAKMESGFYSFDERAKNFVSVVEAAIQGIRPIADRRKQAIELRVHAPRAHAAFSTEGITHAVENLLMNAVKYGDNAHPITVDITEIDEKPVPQLELRVTNRGRGLLPSELTLVFERFFRASNADGQKGVGLGLSVVRRIIEAHHGKVAAESADGVTTFYFRIPQRYQSEARAGIKPALATVSLAMLVFLNGCSALARRQAPELATHSKQTDKKLAGIAIDMLDPSKRGYNPEKGRTYLEYSLKRGTISALEVPAPVLLDLLRSERVAAEKSRTLEQQLEIMKEIDLTREEEQQ